MVTNRLKFQNIDQSFTTGTNTVIQGGTVIKASKGLTIPQYVQQGDTQTFLNLFGTPSAQYPGVQEALDYLATYSLWVSAPAGAGSYIGGTYFTTLGSMESFYQVAEDSSGGAAPNYMTTVQSGDSSPLSGKSVVSALVSGPITVTGIPSQFFIPANVTGIILTYTRSDYTIATVTYTVSGTTLTAANTGAPGTGTISQTGTNISLTAVPGYAVTVGTTTYNDLNFAVTLPASNLSVQWVYNIQPYVCLALAQNSPRATTGTVFLNSPTAVDTRQIIYPSYTSTFVITGSGTLTGNFGFSIAGTPIIGTFSGSPATPTAVANAMSTAMAGMYLPGYTIDFASSPLIKITYQGNYIQPTIVLTSGFTGYAVSQTVTYSLTGSGTVPISSPFTIGGYNTVIGTVTPYNSIDLVGAALVTAINALSLTGWGTASYLSGVITIIYPATLTVAPSLALGTGFSTYATAMASNPNSPNGVSKINPYYNTVTFTYSELAYTGGVSAGTTYTRTFTISPDTTKVDPSGTSLYAGTVLANNNYLRAYTTYGGLIFQPLSSLVTGYQWNVGGSQMAGVRYVSTLINGVTIGYAAALGAVLATGWNAISIPATQNVVNIFFDPEGDSTTVPALMYNLRSTSFPFSTFITGVRVVNDVATSPSLVASAVNAIVTARGSSFPTSTGLAYYCNEFWMTESYNSTSYWGMPMGSIAAMLSRIMDFRIGGAAPMFTNEGSPAVGGQLNKAVIRQKYNFDATSLDTLDSAGVNPIILDTYYGLMMTSQKTAQSALNITDWSFLGHQMSFDLFEAEVRQAVMLPQIGKLIDPYHMQMRKSQTQTLLNKRLTGPTAIWNAGQVYVQEVNTPETMAQNNFMIKVRVQVTPFSEIVTLIFNNVSQTSSVSGG